MSDFYIDRLDPPLEAIPDNHALVVKALRTIADRLEAGEALLGKWSIGVLPQSAHEIREDLHIELKLYTKR